MQGGVFSLPRPRLLRVRRRNDLLMGHGNVHYMFFFFLIFWFWAHQLLVSTMGNGRPVISSMCNITLIRLGCYHFHFCFLFSSKWNFLVCFLHNYDVSVHLFHRFFLRVIPVYSLHDSSNEFAATETNWPNGEIPKILAKHPIRSRTTQHGRCPSLRSAWVSMGPRVSWQYYTYSNVFLHYDLGRNAFSETLKRSMVPRRHQNRIRPLVLRCSNFRAMVSRLILGVPETWAQLDTVQAVGHCALPTQGIIKG